MTFLGEVNGYILIVTAVYVMFDKSLGVGSRWILLMSMMLNHLLKIHRQRSPGRSSARGTYLQKWAVSPDCCNARTRNRIFHAVPDTRWRPA